MKLLHGGLSTYDISGRQVGVATRESLCHPVEVMVFEEDTNLILTVDKAIYYREIHPIRVMTDIMGAKKHKPGTLVCNGDSWYAVVIDVDDERICQTSWIREAYGNIFKRLEEEKIVCAAMHVLGIIHGGIIVDRAIDFFYEGLKAEPAQYLKRIWLLADEKNVGLVRKGIAAKYNFRS